MDDSTAPQPEPPSGLPAPNPEAVDNTTDTIVDATGSRHKQPKSQTQQTRHRHRQHHQKQAKQHFQDQQQHHQEQEEEPQGHHRQADKIARPGFINAATNNDLQDSPDISPRVVFGPGTLARLPAELARIHVSTPVIVSSPSRVALARKVQGLLADLDSSLLDSATAHTVVDDVLAQASGRDCVISVGGSSAVSLARVIGMRKGIPHVCIPTTYSGSENSSTTRTTRTTRTMMTPRDDHRDGKRPAHSLESRIVPDVVIYDEDLTRSVPKRFSAPSGPSAMAPSSDSDERSKDEDALWSYLHLPGV